MAGVLLSFPISFCSFNWPSAFLFWSWQRQRKTGLESASRQSGIKSAWNRFQIELLGRRPSPALLTLTCLFGCLVRCAFKWVCSFGAQSDDGQGRYLDCNMLLVTSLHYLWWTLCCLVSQPELSVYCRLSIYTCFVIRIMLYHYGIHIGVYWSFHPKVTVWYLSMFEARHGAALSLGLWACW